jgi:hypothetical protein
LSKAALALTARRAVEMAAEIFIVDCEVDLTDILLGRECRFSVSWAVLRRDVQAYLYFQPTASLIWDEQNPEQPSHPDGESSHDIRQWERGINWSCLSQYIEEATMWVFKDLAY